MDKKVAKELLVKHKEALDILLESDGMGDIKVSADKALKVAEEGTKEFQKTLLEKFREFPIVEKVTSLGTAGTVAVSTAAVTQTELAVDMTQVFVAEVAEDVVEERFEVPEFFEMVVDFNHLNDWGQQVIAEKVAEVSELQSTSQPTSAEGDTKPVPSSSSQDTPSDKSSQKPSTGQSQEQSETKSKTVESKSSQATSESKDTPQEETKEVKQETESPSQEETKAEPTEVKSELPITETPFNPIDDPIKPHSNIRQVSPVS
tara:strand:- start:894 stop:1676 length:783 start_codon:yes stop_codon:yes gene_type:complete